MLGTELCSLPSGWADDPPVGHQPPSLPSVACLLLEAEPGVWDLTLTSLNLIFQPKVAHGRGSN